MITLLDWEELLMSVVPGSDPFDGFPVNVEELGNPLA